MKLKTSKLRSAILLALVAVPMGPALAQSDSDENGAKQLDTITVTGSRIKLADVVGALPVVVIDRVQLETSGEVSVADYLRNTTFNSFGSYQSTSGSSWGGATGVSLRGMGAARTLILVDGRRAPAAPMSGSFQDLNSIPMAAVERIEILSDGASAIYGSDALGGVINIITRRDFEGVEFTYGIGRPSNDGGDTEEMSIIFGSSSDRARVLMGASNSSREVIMTRDRDYWYNPDSPGASTYSNNFSTLNVNSLGTAGRLRHPLYGAAVPGLCTNGDDSDLFWLSGTGPADWTCQFNHSATSANLTSLENTAIFGRGDYQINDDWSVYFNANLARVESFGRFAAVPSSPWPGGSILLPAGSPNHPGTAPENGGLNPNYDPFYAGYADQDLYLYHRFAALGARDNFLENTTYNFMGGFQGTAGIFDLDFGMRYVESRAVNLGTNYVVGGLAQTHITAGTYNIYNPFAGNPNGLGFTSTISRDMKTSTKELFASAGVDLFSLGGGTAALAFGGEYREDYYQDIYDPLSEAGQIVGSAGNSASGGRDVTAAFFEVLLPFHRTFEVNIAGRYDKYSDYGNDFAPKVSFRWQPLDALTFRASYGEGFRAPSLDILTQKASFSATATTDPATCLLLTGSLSCQTQVSTYSIANPNLESEQSKQYSLGVVWDAADWLNVSLDYYNIEVTNQIASIGLATVVGCLRGSVNICPPGLSMFPAGTVVPNVGLGLGAQFDPTTGGIVNAQTGFANIGWIETEGYDLNVRTRFDFDNLGTLNNQFSVSHVANYSSNGGQSVVGRGGTAGNTTPRFRANLNNSWSIGDWDFNWNINYIHGVQSSSYRQWLALERTPNRTAAQNNTMALYASMPDRWPAWVTHDVQVSYKAPWNATITMGVNNLTDKDPVFDQATGGASYDYYLYDPWGRVPYIRYTQRF